MQQGIAIIGGSGIEKLTERQKDCLRLVAQGYTSKEIGRALDLSPSTVDNHILAAVQLLGAPSRGEAARLLVRTESLGETVADISIRTRQNLPRELPELANSKKKPFLVVAADAPLSSIHDRKPWSLPPLGGQKNELDAAERTLRIIQVAVVGFGSVMSLSLLVAGAFKIFS